jgi:16S rRNA (guanine966-N2)-methyltransferase
VTRIIAGRARGRRLTVPRSGTRPTSDRVRESMFASIESRLHADGRGWSDIHVCDLWAGSGALALEAWSRGAVRVVAIDASKSAVDAITANAMQLGALIGAQGVGAQGVSVVRAKVSSAVAGAPAAGWFDLVLADPPYETPTDSIHRDLDAAWVSGWFAPEAIVVVERSVKSPSPFPEVISHVEQRAYGDTVLWYGRVSVSDATTNAAVRST